MRGFTLLEVLVVLGIFAAVAGFTLFMGIDSIARGSAMSERDTLVSLLTSARTAALANIDAMPHGVRIDATNFTLFSGVAYSSLPTSYRIVGRNSAVGITGVTLPVDIIFSQLTATTTAVSPFALVQGGSSLPVEISSEGRIEW